MNRLKISLAALVVVVTGMSAFASKSAKHNFAGPFTYFNRSQVAGSVSAIKSSLTYTLDNRTTVCVQPSDLVCFGLYTANVAPTAGSSKPEANATLTGFGSGTYTN